MLQIKKTNNEILAFVNNANYIIRTLSITGKRNRYLGVLQFQKEHFEKDAENIKKKIQRIQEKHAKVKDTGEFLYEGKGEERTYIYTKEASEILNIELEALLEEVKVLEVNEVFYLKEEDLPKVENKDEVSVSNALLKTFEGFVLDTKTVNKLVYPGLDI
jgi:hypothetical protein